MSDEMKKQLEEAIEQIRQLPPEKQNMCTGFVLGINAASALKPAQPVEQPGERGAYGGRRAAACALEMKKGGGLRAAVYAGGLVIPALGIKRGGLTARINIIGI